MNSEKKHKKKSKMERGLTNRHVQVMAMYEPMLRELLSFGCD